MVVIFGDFHVNFRVSLLAALPRALGAFMLSLWSTPHPHTVTPPLCPHRHCSPLSKWNLAWSEVGESQSNYTTVCFWPRFSLLPGHLQSGIVFASQSWEIPIQTHPLPSLDHTSSFYSYTGSKLSHLLERLSYPYFPLTLGLPHLGSLGEVCPNYVLTTLLSHASLSHPITMAHNCSGLLICPHPPPLAFSLDIHTGLWPD